MRKILRRALAIVLTAVTIVQPMAGYPSIAKAADDNASISINGYQISSIVEGYRTIYTLSDSKSQVAVNSDGSAKVGLIYGIGDSVSNADTDLVIGNVGGNIINSSASITGKSDINYSKDSSDQSYVMTMKFGDGVSAAFYNAKIYIRAYAQLKDGSYIYSNAKSLTIYKLADYLYKNIMMSNAQGHSYLYDSILSVTNSSYKEVSYDWNHAIVPAESSTPKPTVAPTEKPTEAPTVAPTEKPTEEPSSETPVNPDPDDPDEITNLSKGKTGTASSTVHTFVAANAFDGNTDTYWEGSGANQTLSVDLGADATLSYIVVKLNPSSAWGARTQRIEVLGHTQYATEYTTLVAAADYKFDPASGNQIKIPVTGKASDVQLKFVSNTGAGGGQAAEVEVYGIPADNPDFVITGLTANKTSLYENEDLILSAVVKNRGTLSSKASTITFYQDDKKIGTSDVKALAAGESTTIRFNAGNLDAGEYAISAVVDEDNQVIEKREDNNSLAMSGKITVKEVESVDIVPIASWSPSNPGIGDEVDFTVTVSNKGNQNTADSSRTVTVKIKDENGSVVKTLSSVVSGKINVGESITTDLGKWTAANGKYTIETSVTADSGELDVKQKNNTVSSSLYVGRGANMPFVTVEAEALSNKTTGTRLAPNRKLADYAGEASGRSAVLLDSNGEYVEFTLPSATNAIVLRASIPKGTNGTVSVYADNKKIGKINLTTDYSYHMGSPSSLGQLGYSDSGDTAYWLYDDGQLLLDKTYPAGTKLKIQKDSDDVEWVYCDMVEFEKVAAPLENPDPSKYLDASNYQTLEAAVNAARMSSTYTGVYIPAGEWTMTGQITLYGKALDIVGAGMWYTKLVPAGSNGSAGFSIQSGTDGTKIRELSAWSKRRNRSDGPEGKFINTAAGVNHITVDNVWIEHFTCLYWGQNASYNTFTNCRMKNTLADGINMTNGSNYNVISNCYARGTGDDSFALFSAADAGGSINTGNAYSNLTAVCVRRAAAFAIYGGEDNTFKNLYAADTLTYPGLTINSYSFGYQAYGFGSKMTYVDGITMDRCGGDYWTSVGSDDHINDYQNFGAIWVYSGDKELKNITMSNIDINDPTYFGIMIQTMYSGSALHTMSNVNFKDITINNPGRYGIKFNIRAEQGQGSVVGSFNFDNVNVNNPGVQSMYGLSGCPDCTVTKTNCNW
ncbi:CARDB domain-containing protein [Eubacterium sp. AF15-50]|uniref:CARDB domain-containing protein n=1 Tax=Eubacterium sp. AF15-50 TaxID=2293103 RepID=UPI0026736B07|nr:CARDB domain-containing protein [Eubacterium sp. AF15-50]